MSQYEDDVDEKIDTECDYCGLPTLDCVCNQISKESEPEQ